MTITRRGFIKSLFGTAGAATLPVKLLAGAEKIPVTIANTSLDRLDGWGSTAEKVAVKMRELTKATKEAAAAVDRFNGALWDVSSIEFIDEYGGRWTSDDDGMTWTQFVDQSRRTYLPDRERPGQYHVFEDGVLLDREG